MLFQRVWKVMFLACVWRILIQLFVCFSFLDSQTFPSSPPSWLVHIIFFWPFKFLTLLTTFGQGWVTFTTVLCMMTSCSCSMQFIFIFFINFFIWSTLWRDIYTDIYTFFMSCNLLCGLQKLTIIAFFSLKKQYL